jgi:Domain of unknown function (DUF4920)
MNKILYSTIILASLWACSGKQTQETAEQGETVVEATAQNNIGVPVDVNTTLTLTALEEQMVSSDSLADVTVTGIVSDVCQKKGCWMNIKKADGTEMKVTFKDYALFMPKDLAGKEVTIHGIAKNEEIPVETLRHYAEDAGKSKEEIAAITAPKTDLTFEADGVLIK